MSVYKVGNFSRSLIFLFNMDIKHNVWWTTLSEIGTVFGLYDGRGQDKQNPTLSVINAFYIV